jgi:hypothetical protein
MKKIKKSRQSPPVKFSVAWYKPEQWSRLLAISADRENLERTYNDWLRQAEKTLADLAERGGYPEKVQVDTEELLAWANERSLPVNGESRSQYASWLLMEIDQGRRKRN